MPLFFYRVWYSRHAMTKELQQTLQYLTDIIVREYHPEKLILFGSWAWGTPGPDSDVDLFVVKESGKRRIEREKELRLKLMGNKFPPMDILIYTPRELQRRIAMNDCFVRDILERGTVLYG